MEKKNSTEIATLGEFGLIDRLTSKLKRRNDSTLLASGDDAAVIDLGDELLLLTTDMMTEGIDFDLSYFPLKHLGYKAAIVNFSDIYAMNATPTQITVSLGISKRFSVEDLEELYSGIRLACERYNVDLVGGDTCASMTGLTISITCLGEAYDSDIVYRNGAKEHDLVCVTGNLGTAYMGLQLLERERIVMNANENATPAFEGREYLLERQLKPEARRDIIEKLHEAGIKPTAMMDISDGIASDLRHILNASNAGAQVALDKLPISSDLKSICNTYALDKHTIATGGGEDYELLFTAPEGIENLLDFPVYEIGKIVPGKTLSWTMNGTLVEFNAKGYNHF